ncbi:MAG: ABC transporter ATP-binding protein [Muribaculaceae bacterium]|nr:ABC transporter ATP-binding protein [Muribaculaceae bacterium]
MIELKDFSMGYGGRVLLEGVATSFRRGELTALIGRNGTGKSTLLRALAGLNTGYSGDILIEGKPLRKTSVPQLARTVAFVSTARTRVPDMRAADTVALGRAPYTNWIGRMQDQDREAVGKALEAVGMSAFASRTLDSMSDGECQRVMIARALAQDTPVILLDEPTSFLDMPSRYELASLLQTLAHEEGKCIIFSTHEVEIATRMSDTVALIDPPHLIHEGSKLFVENRHLDRLFSTCHSSPYGAGHPEHGSGK